MFNFTVYDPTSGAILRTGTAGTEDHCLLQANEGEAVMLGQARFDQRVVNGAIVDAPDLELESSKKTAKLILHVSRENKAGELITFNGTRLDADSAAQANMKDKITEIDLRIKVGPEMPSDLLVWKDHDNNIKTFGSMEELQSWLSGALVAIADRTSRTHLNLWKNKALLDGCKSPEAVQKLVFTW